MDKNQVASILDEIGTLLAIGGENPFRCNAYHNAARALQQLEEDLSVVIREERLREIPGIGNTLQEKITALATTGKLPFYDELKAKFPAGLLDLLRLPGLGPKKVQALYETLKIDDLIKLKAACEDGQVAELKGFGAKSQQKILEGLAFINTAGQRIRIDQALEIAEPLLEGLRKKARGIVRLELCGSLRRRKETINDIDILVSAAKAGPIMDAFVALPGVTKVLGKGETKSSVELDRGVQEGRRLVIQADVRVVTDEQFPFALHYFTGSKEHNIALRARAQSFGLKLNEYELGGPKQSVACKEEADIFHALKLDYIPPEMRENTGEIDAAADHKVPTLIESKDLQGTFHCHTDWSDGRNTLEEMARAAKKMGYKYLGIADHSQSLKIANGLTPERVRKQQADIDALNAKLKGIKLFKGIESDILTDGKLDYRDDVLASFDYVVASVHDHFNLPEPEMTARIVRAVSHPKVTMLGHATGRLLLRRDGYQVDLDAVLKAAAEHGTMIEINAHPERLELDWVHCKRARALGVTIVINPDAHSTHELELLRYGIDVARRAWLEKENVFNTQPVAAVEEVLAKRRGR
jgi:DNA polymerase (family 10)